MICWKTGPLDVLVFGFPDIILLTAAWKDMGSYENLPRLHYRSGHISVKFVNLNSVSNHHSLLHLSLKERDISCISAMLDWQGV